MKLRSFILFMGVIIIFTACSNESVKEIRLEGEWTVILDSLNMGMEKACAKQKQNGTPIHLPETLDDAKLGKANTLKPAMDNTIMWGLMR